ncbi:MAG TPA: hypothetical protein VMU69_10230 [Bradyrhizobium sp.]|nr:hypothetical protein [Bradyrhizobium sp.]
MTDRSKGAAQQRRRVKQIETLEERLVKQAQRLRDEAAGMSPGLPRETALRKARQAEMAARMDGWLRSSDLQPPK